jgi:hypothetical protein
MRELKRAAAEKAAAPPTHTERKELGKQTADAAAKEAKLGCSYCRSREVETCSEYLLAVASKDASPASELYFHAMSLLLAPWRRTQ